MQKDRRHEQAWYQIDEYGNETEIEAPERDDRPLPARSDSNGKQRQPQRSSRAGRTPLPPSWRRSSKRALILGAIVFAFFGFLQRNLVAGLSLGVIYTALFIPFTYYLDRFGYRRWLRNHPTKR